MHFHSIIAASDWKTYILARNSKWLLLRYFYIFVNNSERNETNYLYKTYLICNVIYDDDTMCTSVVTRSYGSKSLLTCRIPLKSESIWFTFLSLQFKPLKHSLSCTLMNIKINGIFTMLNPKTSWSRQYPAWICLFKVNNGTSENFLEVYFLPFQYHSLVQSGQKRH